MQDQDQRSSENQRFIYDNVAYRNGAFEASCKGSVDNE